MGKISTKRSIFLLTILSMMLIGCSTESDRNNKRRLGESQESEKKISSKDTNQENTQPYIQPDERLTPEEKQKFLRDEDETVPVVLEGNSTGETLKAYLTQSLFNRGVQQVGVMNEMAMDMDDGAVAMPEMAMADSPMMMTMTRSAQSVSAKTAVATTSTDTTATTPPSAPMDATEESGGSTGGEAEAFSGTNTQEKGVDEGDIWKYDGETFYVLTKTQNVYYPMMSRPRVMVSEPMVDPVPVEAEEVDVVDVVDVDEVDGTSETEVDTKVYYDTLNGKEETTEGGTSDSSGESSSDDGDSDEAHEDEEGERKEIDVATQEILPCKECGGNQQKNALLRIVTKNKETLSKTDLGDLRADEMYLAGKNLVLVGNKRPSGGDWGDYRHWQQGVVNVKVMDVSDPKMPKAALKVELQGHKIRTRRIGDELYVVSRFSPYIEKLNYRAYTEDHMDTNKKLIDEMPVENMLPTISINGDVKPLVTPEQCWLTVMPKDNWGSPTLTLVTKISITTGAYQSTCVGGDVQGIYMSQNALYLYNTSYMTFNSPVTKARIMWNWREGNTHIHKFELTQLGYSGSQLIDGIVGHKHASFRFGELKDGSLGVVTTKSEWNNPQHRLAVLGDMAGKWDMKAMLPNPEKPEPIGKPNERIYSVRFMQDRAYIVTFQQTDPLYVIDLSVPDKPYIAGELKIPGFSDYLHPIGTDKLLGVGMEAATNEHGGTVTLGVKVSLFDVSDITQPKDAGSQIIGRRGSSTALSQNHLAFTGIQQANSYRFAFPIQVHEGTRTNTYYEDPKFAYNDWLHTGLYMFEVKEGVLSTAGAVITDQKSAEKTYGSYGECRGLIQGEQVYHLKNDQLYKAEWANPKGAEGPF